MVTSRFGRKTIIYTAIGVFFLAGLVSLWLTLTRERAAGDNVTLHRCLGCAAIVTCAEVRMLFEKNDAESIERTREIIAARNAFVLQPGTKAILLHRVEHDGQVYWLVNVTRNGVNQNYYIHDSNIR